jgi:hypothetical protein
MKSAAGPKPGVQLCHLADREPLAERDHPEVHIAAHQPRDDVFGRRRLGEAVLAGFQPGGGVGPRKREAPGERVVHHAGVHEQAADRLRTGAGRDVDELFLSSESPERLPRPGVELPPDPRGRQRREQHKHEDDAEAVLHHGSVMVRRQGASISPEVRIPNPQSRLAPSA